MGIADIATQEFIEVDADERLGKVRSIFEEQNPKGIVVTENADYAGVITQKQLLQSHIEDHTKASALMTTAPKVSRHEDIRDTARMLVEGNTKVAPVFEGESLWGIVTDDNTDAQTVATHLLEKELVTEKEGVLYLTSRGEIVVTEQLESVNE